MLFVQPLFFAFFAAVFLLYWAIPGDRARKRLLLVASYVFYAAWDYRFLALIFVSTSIDYFVGSAIARTPRTGRRRRVLLIASLTSNLGILGFFKYFNFFIDSANNLFQLCGFSPALEPWSIILPVGISFFTFQSLSYTIDVYRNKLEPIHNFFDFALFVAFFPQLVAGPIVRAAEFFPQMLTRTRFKDVQVRAALILFFAGFVKKACIADNLAVPVDAVFAEPIAYDLASTWVAVLAYAAQIYCDFSGYTDMAIAVAALLGYRLPLNFIWPYLARNVREFWRRWHVTLSTWLRDYLYISVGGNRGETKLFTMRNLMITMLLGGLWHGAAWNFVIWGGLHGIALIVHREWLSKMDFLKGAVWTPLKIAFTFYFVCVAWIFFRAESIMDAFVVCKSFLFFASDGIERLAHIGDYCFVLSILVVVHVIGYHRDLTRPLETMPTWAFAFLYGIGIAFALPFVPVEYRPFVYFQF